MHKHDAQAITHAPNALGVGGVRNIQQRVHVDSAEPVQRNQTKPTATRDDRTDGPIEHTFDLVVGKHHSESLGLRCRNVCNTKRVSIFHDDHDASVKITEGDGTRLEWQHVLDVLKLSLIHI